ncbi:MAG: hypothetical protein ICV55_15875 [Coleofasciculus sp. C3-bin4]|nr:hypothetical protein [Coleofasciculus sp. C3-bin4]
MPSNLLSIALNNMQLSSQLHTNQRWQTFEEILQRLHKQGIYIHSEQLAEFLLRHGLPVHLRYVPAHLHSKAIQVNQNYQGDMVRQIEELEQPCWDFSWMDNIQMPVIQNYQSNQVRQIEEREQPAWDSSWVYHR